MKVSVSQIYVEPNASFPFSHVMQRWLSGRLSSLAKGADGFIKKYGQQFKLVLNISAERQLTKLRIAGPTVFKRTNDVEYTVFLPFDEIVAAPEGCRSALGLLLDAVRQVFEE